MAVRRFLIVAAAAAAVAGPATLGAPEPTTNPINVPGSGAIVLTGADAKGIELIVKRNGLLVVTLTWDGGSAPYDVLIDPQEEGESSTYRQDVDDDTLSVAAERAQSYCYEVFGADGSESGRECVSAAE